MLELALWIGHRGFLQLRGGLAGGINGFSKVSAESGKARKLLPHVHERKDTIASRMFYQTPTHLSTGRYTTVESAGQGQDARLFI